MPRISICLLLIFSINLGAQSPFNFNRSYDVPVSVDGEAMSFPWLGGINSAQFSNIDFNQDGLMDLFMFDKTDNSISTFVYDEVEGMVLTPAYTAAFPELIEWALLRDYNQDGVMDIFSATVNDRINVYQGALDNGNWSFGLVIEELETTDGEAIFVAGSDIPAIDDINGDGFIDILTFDDAGTFVVLYANGSASLQFEMTDDCWGNFYEQGNSPALVLNSCTVGSQTIDLTDMEKSGVHPGSTLATTDLNGDGLKELLLGDIAFNKLTQLNNEGTLEEANVTEQDTNFPSSNVPVDVDIFPGAYFVDTDGDGQNELLCSPNNPISSESYFCVWKYDDVNPDDTQDFFLSNKAFMVDETIDLSRMAYPTFFDYNFDGLTDLLIGNYGSKWFDNNQSVSSLSLFVNVGTPSAPAFELITNDFLNLSQLGMLDLYPAVGNIRGTNDLLLGTSTPGDANGTLVLIPNTTISGASEMSFGPPEFFFQNIDVVQNSTPQIVDVDRDGKDDLVIGQRNGLVHYYRQETDGDGEAVFVEVDDDFFGWGDLSVVNTAAGTATGHSSPFLCDLDNDGNWELFVGSETDGFLHLYNDIEANLEGGAFNLVTEQALGEDYKTGKRMAIALSDQLIEDKWVMLLGNRKGGLQFLILDDEVSIADTPNILGTYPNPTSGIVYLDSPEHFDSVRVWDSNGKLLIEHTLSSSNAVDLSDFSNGVYLLEWMGAERFVSKVSLLK